MEPDADVGVDQGYELDCCSQNGEEELVPSDDDGEDVGVKSLDYDAFHNVVHDTLLKKRHSSRRIYGYHSPSPPASTCSTATSHRSVVHKLLTLWYLIPVEALMHEVISAATISAPRWSAAGTLGSHLQSGRLPLRSAFLLVTYS